MSRGIVIGLCLLIVLAMAAAVAWLIGNRGYRTRMATAETAWSDLATKAYPATDRFDQSLITDLPEIAQRYFTHAIAAGTPLATTVEITMQGTFRLGSPGKVQDYAMQARQILSPPGDFVWIARMNRGVIRFSGSDGLSNGHGWTRFWMFRALPLVQASGTEDIDRAAAARPALEAIWAPASLLPANGATWLQTGPDTARITYAGTAANPIDMTLAPDGRVTQVVTERWSDVNPAKTFRLQPFGGTLTAEATFSGFTVPTAMLVGNNFGTTDFDGFFSATITSATYR